MKKLRNVSFIFFLAVVIILFWRLVSVDARTIPPEQRIGTEPFIVECTAYNDEGTTASGHPTVDGLTMAGAPEWIGCAAVLYEVDQEGRIGDLIGIYQFTDTGYGRDGDIPRGETVDIYMPDLDDCMQWGRRKVYIQIIDGKG